MSVENQALLSPYHAYRPPYHAPPAPLLSVASASYPQHQHPQQLRSLLYSISTPGFSVHTNAYMNPTLPQPPLQHSFSLSPRHGIKRNAPDADDEFERSSHISTHFKKLRLNNQQNPQFDTASPPASVDVGLPATNRPLSVNHEPPILPSALLQQRQQSAPPVPTLPSNDFMTVDETPNKIYIADLDSEIAAIEAAERPSPSSFFLPDFEKQIGAIPGHVLRPLESGQSQVNSQKAENNNQALVLYQEPTSISVPEEEDAVRKAILEARRGIREKMRRQSQRERETAHIDLARADPPSAPPVLPTTPTPPLTTITVNGTNGMTDAHRDRDTDSMDMDMDVD